MGGRKAQPQRCWERTLQPQSDENVYDFIRTISEGSYGDVHLCSHRVTGEQVAIKRFKTAHLDPKVWRLAMREARVLQQLPRHPNIIELRRAVCSQASGRLYFVFEYMERSLLQDLRSSPHGILPAEKLKSVAWQLLEAIAHCHENKVVHRDMKPANVLVSGGAPLQAEAAGGGHGGGNGTTPHTPLRVKLCDFGLARWLPTSMAAGTGTGVGQSLRHAGTGDGAGGSNMGAFDQGPMSPYLVTRWYRAPEILVGDTYGNSVDIWSYGCTLAELASGIPLFPGSSSLDQLWRITRCLGPLPAIITARLRPESQLAQVAAGTDRGRPLPQKVPTSDPHLLDLIAACLTLDPRRRPSAAELMGMPYFDTLYCDVTTPTTPQPTPPSQIRKLLVQGLQSTLSGAVAIGPAPAPAAAAAAVPAAAGTMPSAALGSVFSSVQAPKVTASEGQASGPWLTAPYLLASDSQLWASGEAGRPGSSRKSPLATHCSGNLPSTHREQQADDLAEALTSPPPQARRRFQSTGLSCPAAAALPAVTQTRQLSAQCLRSQTSGHIYSPREGDAERISHARLELPAVPYQGTKTPETSLRVATDMKGSRGLQDLKLSISAAVSAPIATATTSRLQDEPRMLLPLTPTALPGDVSAAATLCVVQLSSSLAEAATARVRAREKLQSPVPVGVSSLSPHARHGSMLAAHSAGMHMVQTPGRFTSAAYPGSVPEKPDATERGIANAVTGPAGIARPGAMPGHAGSIDEEGRLLIETQDLYKTCDGRDPLWPTDPMGRERSGAAPTALGAAAPVVPSRPASKLGNAGGAGHEAWEPNTGAGSGMPGREMSGPGNPSARTPVAPDGAAKQAGQSCLQLSTSLPAVRSAMRKGSSDGSHRNGGTEGPGNKVRALGGLIAGALQSMKRRAKDLAGSSTGKGSA